MSKRSERKEHLARQLDAGRISQAVYDEQIARMSKRGKGHVAPSTIRTNEQLVDRILAKGEEVRNPRLADIALATGRADWRPAAGAEPLSGVPDADLIAELKRRGYIISKPL